MTKGVPSKAGSVLLQVGPSEGRHGAMMSFLVVESGGICDMMGDSLLTGRGFRAIYVG